MAFILLFVPPARAASPNDPNADYLLHLPGIGGYRWIDRELVAGIKEGGYDGRLAVHDWTGDHPGLEALVARQRNEQEAQRVAEALTKRYRENPKRRIVITAHSGGTGVAVWALEKLPADVRVDTVLLLASALSPDYDLSESLRRVRGKMYSFSSVDDTLVLGVGTRTFGTIDGVKCDAAGRVGFVLPEGVAPAAYEKLVQVPYAAAWMDLDNIGDHVGVMRRPFAREVLAPIVKGGHPRFVTLPTVRAVTPPATQATTRPTRSAAQVRREAPRESGAVAPAR